MSKNKFRCMTCDKMTADKNAVLKKLNEDIEVFICIKCANVIYTFESLNNE